jgi:hypothetical protein
VAAQLHAERQLAVLSGIVDTLEGASIAPVVFKGLPLSMRLYGDFGLRVSSDLDVFVPADVRPAARDALERAGWRSVSGAAPLTETFVGVRDGGDVFVEIHSAIVDENLAHMRPRAPLARRAQVGERYLPVFDDPVVPAYLAAHASKHMPAALLYYIDFHALWTTLDEDAQAEGRRAAREVGLDGYLRWMLRKVSALQPAARGDRKALASLGIRASGRRDTHAVFRDVWLAPSITAAGLGAAAWLWPPQLRHDHRAFLRRCLHRSRASWTSYVFPRAASKG